MLPLLRKFDSWRIRRADPCTVRRAGLVLQTRRMPGLQSKTRPTYQRRVSPDLFVSCSNLLRCHANRAVQADDFAVQHFVLDDVLDERGVLGGAAKPRREGHLLGEAVARRLWKARH